MVQAAYGVLGKRAGGADIYTLCMYRRNGGGLTTTETAMVHVQPLTLLFHNLPQVTPLVVGGSQC